MTMYISSSVLQVIDNTSWYMVEVQVNVNISPESRLSLMTPGLSPHSAWHRPVLLVSAPLFVCSVMRTQVYTRQMITVWYLSSQEGVFSLQAQIYLLVSVISTLLVFCLLLIIYIGYSLTRWVTLSYHFLTCNQLGFFWVFSLVMITGFDPGGNIITFESQTGPATALLIAHIMLSKYQIFDSHGIIF